MTATVTKLAARRFAVQGSIAVIAGRVANEPYVAVFTSLKAAQADAASLDRINAGALANLSEARAYRIEAARAYLAARAARVDTAQIGFAF